ncbi:hypothetical protein [Nocardioides sp.]|uniref:hypothetical protein n=1 Tax=Nocardioides sp. TaxID=35761 RepID=UPI002BF1477E|nr:hypothetical protein [Nocardioides sp.]HXH79530.1 hypothetical protein [Nocardioides sp.]
MEGSLLTLCPPLHLFVELRGKPEQEPHRVFHRPKHDTIPILPLYGIAVIPYQYDPTQNAIGSRTGDVPTRISTGIEEGALGAIKPADAGIVVDPIKTEVMQIHILGTTPLILNRLSEKAKHDLLLPTGRKTTADRAATLKHDPIAEFRASPYMVEDEDAPTLLAHMSSAFKGAAMTASLDLPGTRKAQIGRLLWVRGQQVGVYGIPEVFSTIVRSADMNRTPDVRTRAIVGSWAATILVEFNVPILTARSVVNLFSAAGLLAGVGDWRPEKGKGDYGQFMLVDPDHPAYVALRATAGRDAQVAAMETPVTYDRDTEELLAWFDVEVESRGRGRRAA